MKKFVLFLSFMLVAGSFLVSAPKAAAVTAPVVDKEFLPGFNSYGRDNSVFRSSCTRFTPTRASYTNYFDLAVKNDQGASYPMKASIRSAIDPTMPNTSAIKSYTQSTFNNYAMSGNLLSRFTSNDGETISLTIGANYFVCIDDLANNNATGWFYTLSVPGGYSIQGYPTEDVQNKFDGSFGYRTFAYEPTTPATDSGTTGTTGSTGSTGSTGTSGTTGSTSTSTSNTTGNSNVANGAAPTANPSSSIAKPTSPNAVYTLASKAVVITWKASTTASVGGYNIYRSTTAGSGYTKIADTASSVLTFNDTSLKAGTTYYYVIRTYKGTLESVSSDEVSALVPADAVVTTAADDTANKTTTTVIEDNRFLSPLFLTLVGAGLVLICLLALLIIRRKRIQKNSKTKTPESTPPAPQV